MKTENVSFGMSYNQEVAKFGGQKRNLKEGIQIRVEFITRNGRKPQDLRGIETREAKNLNLTDGRGEREEFGFVDQRPKEFVRNGERKKGEEIQIFRNSNSNFSFEVEHHLNFLILS